MRPPAAPFEHLLRLTDTHGIFEHARFRQARPEHGYCVDDVARGLVVASREIEPSPEVLELGRLCLRFLASSQDPSGLIRNRFGSDLRWSDEPSAQDAWGRALWGLGTAAGRRADLAAQALACFEVSADIRSPHPRAMAFASLAAGEVLAAYPTTRRHDGCCRMRPEPPSAQEAIHGGHGPSQPCATPMRSWPRRSS